MMTKQQTMAHETLAKIQKTRSPKTQDKLAHDAARYVREGDHTGYGPTTYYDMPDGSTLTYDGRGWMAHERVE